MSFPNDPLPNQWTLGENPNAVQMHARVDVPLNQLGTVVGGMQSGAVTTNITTTGSGYTSGHTSFPTAYASGVVPHVITQPHHPTTFQRYGIWVGNIDNTGFDWVAFYTPGGVPPAAIQAYFFWDSKLP